MSRAAWCNVLLCSSTRCICCVGIETVIVVISESDGIVVVTHVVFSVYFL